MKTAISPDSADPAVRHGTAANIRENDIPDTRRDTRGRGAYRRASSTPPDRGPGRTPRERPARSMRCSSTLPPRLAHETSSSETYGSVGSLLRQVYTFLQVPLRHGRPIPPLEVEVGPLRLAPRVKRRSRGGRRRRATS